MSVDESRKAAHSADGDGGSDPAGGTTKIAIYVVAQNAVSSLTATLDRIPARVRERVDEIFVCDAASADDTYLLGVGYKAVRGYENLTVVRSSGRGYGAASKSAIEHCREQGFGVVALLHADGNYAPEVVERLLDPLVRGEVDAVVGTRFPGDPPDRTRMPLHKRAAIRMLGALEEALLGLGLSDYHCGYQAYSVPALADLPYELNSDSLVFNTELLIQMKQKGLRVVEVPVPVYTGAETDGLSGVRYALAVLRVVLQYWMHSRGIREYDRFAISEKYPYKRSRDASHQKILALVDRDRQRILDVGCGAGFLAEALSVRGNAVVGVDSRRAPGVEERMESFLQIDLDREEIPLTGAPFDWIVVADVLEHVRNPAELLARCRKLLAEEGRLVLSVPNVAHWSVRLPLLLGRFRYSGRGILDRSHLHFYTLASIRDELAEAGFEVERVEPTPPPFEDLFETGMAARTARVLARVSSLGNRLWRGLFAYQFVLRARKTRP